MNIALDVGILYRSLLKMAVVKRVVTFAGLVPTGGSSSPKVLPSLIRACMPSMSSVMYCNSSLMSSALNAISL